MRIYKQAATPTVASDDLKVGDIWIDTTAGAIVKVGTAADVFDILSDTVSPSFTTPVLGAASATSLDFTSTAGIIGTTTNNNANAGSVGEYVQASVARTAFPALTTATIYDVTSIELTAGDWDVFGCVGFAFSGTTTCTQVIGSINLTSATLPANHYWSTIQPRTGNGLLDTSMAIVPQRISISSTTTIYLMVKAVFATAGAFTFGTIGARRVR